MRQAEGIENADAQMLQLMPCFIKFFRKKIGMKKKEEIIVGGGA